MASKTLYMETTMIPPEKTAGEIISKLVQEQQFKALPAPEGQ